MISSYRFLASLAFMGAFSVPQMRSEPPQERDRNTPDLHIGSRRELFVDDHLIDKMDGAELKLHLPEDRGVVLTMDAPWEGNTSAYNTIIKDGDLYRMYYRGWHHEGGKAKHPPYVCYAESKDGVNWTKPILNLVEVQGSKKNNIIWEGVGSHNFVPFIDKNPTCKPNQRYKAVGGEPHEGGLHGFVSSDGLRWKKVQDKPILPMGGWTLDSQNLVFWDTVREEYRMYYRTNPQSVRSITTATSQNFLDWGAPAQLTYPGSPTEELYTNQIQPYYRAPHMFLGFPARYLKQKGHTVEPLFMSSRDGITFKRWPDVIVPPGDNEDKKGNRCNYAWCGLVETLTGGASGTERELSFYTNERYYRGPGGKIRRHSYRLDGMVSLHAEKRVVVITKPFIFAGNRLEMNFKTAPGGMVQVEITSKDGRTNPALNSGPLSGDHLEKVVLQNLHRIAGHPVLLKITIQNADVFSFKFDD